MWAGSHTLDARRSRPPDALDSLDACDSFVAGRGALAIIALIRFTFNGGIPPACRPWFLGGRLIALRKEGDSPALRKIRPIAIGSALGRVVSICAAADSTVRFATLFQPPSAQSCASRPRTQTDGSPSPVQLGAVCCRNCTEIAHHAVSALLDSHPTYVDVSLDVRNAFNSISRDAFMPLVKSHLPDLLPWIGSMYGETIPTSFMVIPHSPTSPLPKSYPKEAVGKDAPWCSALCLGAAPPLVLLGPTYWSGTQDGSVISYRDDLHLVGSPSTVSLALKALLHPSPPLDAALSLDCRLSTIGLALSHGKSSILMGRDVTPNTLGLETTLY